MTAGPGALRVRPVRPDDATALASMFGRCSAQTRYRRFHGFVTEIPAAYLRRCLEPGPGAHRAFVAEVMTGGTPRLVGLASAGPVREAPHVHEVGALVEDAWQRQGTGRRLVGALSADARAAGVEVFRMELCRAQPSLLAYVIANAHVLATERSGCDVTVDVTVPAAGVPGDGLMGRSSPAAAKAP
jgi:GNAT superfamily N-acetyltransferase